MKRHFSFVFILFFSILILPFVISNIPELDEYNYQDIYGDEIYNSSIYDPDNNTYIYDESFDKNVSEYFPDENSCKYMYSDYSIGLIDECLNYNAYRGPEFWGLQYYIDNNNQVTIFKEGIIETLSFAGTNYGPSFSAKMVRYYEDGKREIVSERNYRLTDDIFSIDDWSVLMNVKNKEATLEKNNLKVTNIDFLSKNNKIETQIIEGELYSEPVQVKFSLLDLYYCENEKKYISITAGVEDMERGEVYIDPIDSSEKNEVATLSRDGVLSVELDKNKKFSFSKKVPYVYEDKSGDDRFVIGLVDFYIEGDETENYVELSFIKTSYKKLDGIFEFVYLRKIDGYDTYDKRSFTIEELNYMGYYDLRNPFQCSINSQCLFDGKCYPLGYRKDNRYCSEERFNFRFQKESEEFCENNFECVSNVCLENECVSVNFLQKVVNWFKKILNIE